MRRLRVVCALAVIGTAVAAYSLPRLAAQTSSAASSASAPVVVAGGAAVRALAIAPAASSTDATALPAIYFTAADHGNRLLSLAPANRAAAAAPASASSNFATIAGNGDTGSLGDGGEATSAQLNLKLDSLNQRSSVAIAADGTIFIADTRNSTIRRIAAPAASDAGVIRSIAGKWAPAQNIELLEPMGIALDRAGNLYIADHGANVVIELHAATSATGGKLEILAHVPQPAGIAVTADGSRVFVASPDSANVFSFDPKTRAISQIMGAAKSSAAAASSQTAASENHGACPAPGNATPSQKPCPAGLAADGGANLFVADALGNQILRIDAATRKTTVAASNISTPGEIAFDSSGNLFVAEQGRNRISEIKSLGVPVSGVTLTAPPAITPPPGAPCPAIPPPSGFTSNFNFCAEPLGGSTPTAAFVLANNTTADITGVVIGTIGIAPGDFVNSSTSCSSTLRAGANCTINLAFAPTATGTRSATLAVTYLGAALPAVSAVAGTGEDYQLALADGQLMQISTVAGSKATFNLQVIPDATFTGNIDLVCPGNMPAETTCSFSPASPLPIPAPGTAVPFSVAFQTTTRLILSRTAPRSPGFHFPSGAAPLAIPLFAAIAMALGLSSLRRRNACFHFASVVALCALAAALMAGCGGGGPSESSKSGTPAGSYKMTVQGSTQGASRGVTVILDVQ